MMNERGCGRGGDEQVEALEKQDEEEEGEEGVGILQVTDCVCVCVCVCVWGCVCVCPWWPHVRRTLRRYPLGFPNDG